MKRTFLLKKGERATPEIKINLPADPIPNKKPLFERDRGAQLLSTKFTLVSFSLDSRRCCTL